MSRIASLTRFARYCVAVCAGLILLAVPAARCPAQGFPGGGVQRISIVSDAKGEYVRSIDDDTIEVLVKDRQKGAKTWKLKMIDESDVKVTGTATTAALRQGMVVRLKGTFKSGMMTTEPIKELEIVTVDKNNALMATVESDALSEQKPKPGEPREWSICGRIMKPPEKNRFVLDCGTDKKKMKRATCDIAEDATIKINASRPRLFAAKGDKIELDFLYVRGKDDQAYVVSLDLEMTKPLALPADKSAAKKKSGEGKTAAGAKSKSKPAAGEDDAKSSTAKSDEGPAESDSASFKSKECGFSIHFSADPHTTKHVIESDDRKLTIHMFSVDQDGVVFFVACIDFGDSGEEGKRTVNVEGSLDGFRDGIVRSTKSRIVSEAKITLGDVPGRELCLESLDGSKESIWRIYLKDARQYKVAIEAPKGQLPAEDARKSFFDSFKLLDK